MCFAFLSSCHMSRRGTQASVSSGFAWRRRGAHAINWMRMFMEWLVAGQNLGYAWGGGHGGNRGPLQAQGPGCPAARFPHSPQKILPSYPTCILQSTCCNHGKHQAKNSDIGYHHSDYPIATASSLPSGLFPTLASTSHPAIFKYTYCARDTRCLLFPDHRLRNPTSSYSSYRAHLQHRR